AVAAIRIVDDLETTQLCDRVAERECVFDCTSQLVAVQLQNVQRISERLDPEEIAPCYGARRNRRAYTTGIHDGNACARRGALCIRDQPSDRVLARAARDLRSRVRDH